MPDYTTRYKGPGYFLNNVDALNRVYQAARKVTIQPDKHNLDRLQREIWKAENAKIELFDDGIKEATDAKG
jgi:hypothetical protein